MLLESIAAYLEARGYGVQGESIFIGTMPEQPDNCLALFDTGGFAPELACDIEYPTFQVLVRGTSYMMTRSKIDNIYRLLHGNTELALLLQAMQNPAAIGQDEAGRHEFSVNFRAIKNREG